MTPEHRSYLRYNEEDFTQWAASMGENTSRTVQYYLTSGSAPEQGYKACASLMKLGERYGKRLEAACEQLLSYSSTPSIRNLSSMLKNGQDKVSTQKQQPPVDNVSHGFTRGAAYFRKDGEQK